MPHCMIVQNWGGGGGGGGGVDAWTLSKELATSEIFMSAMYIWIKSMQLPKRSALYSSYTFYTSIHKS